MDKRNLIVELALDTHRWSFAATAALDVEGALGAAAGVTIDSSFPLTPMPQLASVTPDDNVALRAFAFGLESVTVEAPPETALMRMTVAPSADPAQVAEELQRRQGVVGVFADVPVQPCMICPGSPPMGTSSDVERLLATAALRRCGMDGSGVTVAIVDTGINVSYLNSKGKTPRFDAARSWVPQPNLTPGGLPVGHGTMCAYDVCIAAPSSTLLDIALLTSTASGGTAMEGLLSDAVRAYSHLVSLLGAPPRPGENRSLVVNNSWGMFHPSWDFPIGHPGNYSDNPNHPFNRIVTTLANAGADILFAAGNCGSDCPDGRCRGITNAIYGANSHPAVITVAGVDVSKQRVGYSTKGPGRLQPRKPDVSGFTHFAGSGVYAADGGTSAATPVVAGVVAALRTKRPYDPTRPTSLPSAVKTLLLSTSEDRGAAGFDLEYGAGIVNGEAIRQAACPTPPPQDLCQRFPWLCAPPPHICERFPWICRLGPRVFPPRLVGPGPVGPGPVGPGPVGPRAVANYADEPSQRLTSDPPSETSELTVLEAYWLGVAAGHAPPSAQSPQYSSVGRSGTSSADCCCAGKE